MQINQLSSVDQLKAGDLLAIFSSSNSDTRKASLSALTAYLEENLNLDDKKDAVTTQYSSPNTTGFTVTINDGNVANNSNAWMIITPNAVYADLTIKLPLYTDLVDKQEVLINCTQDVTTLTIDKNGADDVKGLPSGLSANDTFKLKYDKPFKIWYRVA